MAPTIECFSEIARGELLKALPSSNLVICVPTSNPAAYVECESDAIISRLTYWEKGSAFCEIIDAASGDDIFIRHYEINSEADLRGMIDAFQLQLLNDL